MPSTQLISQSGGVGLVSGAIYSGTGVLVGGVQLYLDSVAPGAVYVGLPPLSGGAVTITSGGSLTSGGLADGMKMTPGRDYFIAKTRLTSGIETIRVGVPAASSGALLFWEIF